MLFFLAGTLALNQMLVYTPDSARYIAWANSLAHFEGYIDRTAPEPVRYVIHAPLYPLLIAPVALVFPGSVIAPKLITLSFGVLSLALFYHWTKKKTNERTALGATLLLALNPLVLIYSTQVLSEMPFAVVLILFFLWNEQLIESNSPRAHQTEWKLVAAIVCGIFLREIGLTMMLGAVALYGWRKEYRRASVIALVSALFYLAWYARNELWVAGLEHPPLRNTKLFFQHLYTPNSASLAQELWSRVVANATVYKNYIGKLVFMSDYIPRSHRMISPADLDVKLIFAMLRMIQYPIIVATLAAFAFGWWRLWAARKNIALYGIVLACYAIPILLYPINDIRFMLPMLLLMVHISALGINDLLERQLVGFSPKIIQQVLAAVIALFLLPNIVWTRSFIVNSRAYAANCQAFVERIMKEERYPEQFTQPFHLAGKWIANNAEPNAVVVCRWKELSVWLEGRKVLSFNPEITPESFDNILRDYGAAYLVSVVSTKDLREFEVLIHTSTHFVFETVYRVGNVEVLKISEKGSTPTSAAPTIPLTRADSIRKDFGYALSLLEHRTAARAESLFQSLTLRLGIFGPVVFNAAVAQEFAGRLDTAESSFRYFRTQPQAGSFVQDSWYHLEMISRLRAAAAELNPGQRAAKYNSLGVNYRELGYDKQSYYMFERSLDADSTFFPSHILQAVYCLQDGKKEMARQHWNVARSIDATNSLVQHLERLFKLIDRLKIERDTLKIVNHLVRAAEIYEVAGMRENAIDCYLAILKLNRRHEAALSNLSAIYEIKQRYAPALELTNRLLESKANDPTMQERRTRLRRLMWD